jgi:uncharacterized repeat protein (TIGR01451 family)
VIPALGIQQSYTIEIKDSIAATLPVGSTVGLFSYLTPVLGDQNILNNISFWYAQILGALDPNDLTIYLPEGKAYPEPGDTITYRVRFQNNGNLPSNDVVLLDTLPIGLTPSTVQILEASHHFRYSIEGQVLKIHFDDIQLPDSTRYPTLSQGYVYFQVQVGAEVRPGTMIANRVSILMDNGEAISTNTVSFITGGNPVHEKQGALGVLQLYPNPVTQGEITVQLAGAKGAALGIRLVDLAGNVLMDQSIPSKGKDTIALPTVPTGAYLLFVEHGQETTCQQILILNTQ